MSAIERASGLTLLVLAVGMIALACDDASVPSAPRGSDPAPRPASSPPPSAPSKPTPAPPAAHDAAQSPLPNHAGSVKPQIADAKTGLADYQIYCASCHGQTGGGDGPVAAALPVQPAKHNDGDYMNALSDDYLFKVISEGGPAVGKSDMMAPWSSSLSDAQIRNIIAFIRTLADPPYSN